MHRTLLTAALMLLVSTAASAQSTSGTDVDKLPGLIQKLGSDNFAERERARAELEKIGPAALDALRAAAKSDDLETSRRAGELVRKIEEKNANASILAPKSIHLKLTDVAVTDALAELEKQSGYHIQIGGDQAALKNRKISLDTGAVTFWQAFDQLCQKAGLVEQEAGVTQPPRINQPIIRLPVQIQPIRIQPIQIQKKIQQILPVVPPNANGVAPQLQAILPVIPQGNAKPVQAQAIQVQAIQIIQALQNAQQAQQAAVAPIQFNPGMRPGQGKAGLLVQDGTPKSTPTSYSGAVRVRLLPATAEQRKIAQPGELVFVLDVDAEPRLQNFTLAASPQIEKAIDDQGQTLQVAMNEQNANPNVAGNPQINPLILQRRIVFGSNGYQQMRQQALVRFKAGEKPAKVIKELTGAVSAQALTTSEPVVVVKNILKAAGQTEASNGYSMKIISVEKQANGDVKVEVGLDGNGQNAGQVFQGGGIQIQGNVQINGNVIINGVPIGNNTGVPELLDANGRSFRLSNTPGRRISINNGQVSSQLTLVFSPGAGQGEPDRLVLSGQRTATFQVPFAFKDVPVE